MYALIDTDHRMPTLKHDIQVEKNGHALFYYEFSFVDCINCHYVGMMSVMTSPVVVFFSILLT